MALKTLNNINIKLNVKFLDNRFNFGDILKISYNASEEDLYFYLVSYDIAQGYVYVKPLSQNLFSVGNGIFIGDVMHNITSGSYCTISGPLRNDNLINKDFSKYINSVDQGEYSGVNEKNRHNLIYFDGGGSWNSEFLKKTIYENSNKFSFISVNEVGGIPNLYRDIFDYPLSAIKISKNYCIIHSKSINYYLQNGVKFLNKYNKYISRKIVSSNSILEYIKNTKSYREKNITDNLDPKINNIFVCKFDSPIDDVDEVDSVKFIPSNYSMNKNDVSNDFILIDRTLSAGLFKSEWNDYSGSFIRIKNHNNLDIYNENDYVTDYIYGLMPQDDLSILFGSYRGEVFIIGILLFDDMVSSLGIVNDGKKFGVFGRDFSGDVAKYLYDSGNYCTVSNISFRFDGIFVDFVKDSVEYDSDGSESVHIINIDSMGANGSKENYDFRKVYHSYFVGENLPKVIDAKFSTEENDSYVNGGSFLERNVSPIPIKSNFSGDLGRSSGLSYTPSYAYEKNQFKVFHLPFNGNVKVDVPKNILFKNYYKQTAYSSSHNISFCLNEYIGRYKSSQFENILSESGEVYDGQNKMEKNSLGLFYKNSEGELSNIFRHDCAAIMFYLSSSLLSFSEGVLDNKFNWNESFIIIGPDFYGSSLSSYISSYSFVNSSSGLGICDKDGNLINGSSKDIDIIKYEVFRIIKCIREFQAYVGTDVYEDFISHARNCAISNKIENIDDYINKLKSNLSYISKMKIFLGGFGEPEVDIFANCRDEYGGIVPNFPSNDELYEYLHGSVIYNTSSELSEKLDEKVKYLSNSGTSDIWNSYFHHEDNYLNSYSKKNDQSNIRKSINKHIDLCVDRWSSLIDYFLDYIDGYVLYCYDDVTFVDYEEVKARNYYLLNILNKKISNSGLEVKSAIGFSPISFTFLRSSYNYNVNNYYLINSDRIIENAIKPCLSNCNLFLQFMNIDNFILDSFSALDLYYNQENTCLLENARSYSCFFSSIYNPDIMSDLYFKEIFSFPVLNSGNPNAFSNYYNLFLQNSYENVSGYQLDVLPFGSEIVDSSIDLDRFGIRKNIIYLAQDIISKQVGEVVYFIINNLKYSDNDNQLISISKFYTSMNPDYSGNLYNPLNVSYENSYFIGDFIILSENSLGDRYITNLNTEKFNYES